MYSVFKKIVSSITIIVAIIFSVYRSLVKPLDSYENMILSLLILITTSFLLETFDEKNKWKKVDNINNIVTKLKDIQVTVYENSDEWIAALNEILKDGKHIVDTASIDATTRTKVRNKSKKLWEHVNYLCSNPNIKCRLIMRIRKNNYENLLDRIISGSSKCDSYFSYYILPPEFPFATFGIIDNKYVCTRSPYSEGEVPKYLIFENTDLVNYFNSWFNQLWLNAERISSMDDLLKIYNLFVDEFTEEQKEQLQIKHSKIQEEGIIDDI